MFKIGNEVLVKAKIAEFDLNRMMYLCELHEEDCLIRFYCPEDFVASKTYEMGLNDAWELAKKIYDTTHADRNKIFGMDNSCNGIKNVFEMFTPEEALAKIEAYEKENEIKVGDVVSDNCSFGLVTRKQNGILYVMMADGSCGEDEEPESWHKTGKHIDIESLLRQIGE